MPRSLLFIILVAIAYAVFEAPGFLLGKPIPESLVFMYMFFSVVSILLAMTATEEGAKALFRPVKRLLSDGSLSIVRNIVFVLIAVFAGVAAYRAIRPDYGKAPLLRSMHPAPPARIRAYGRDMELAGLVNPFRRLEKDDPKAFSLAVFEGGEVYYRNCFFCHGDKLDGAGHYAAGLNPAPLPFKGRDTIAQLSEPYVFWRVVKGGPGLPREGAPWASSMPAWEAALSEEDVWKVVSFIYESTGNRPRVWIK